ncbi:MAG: hypothetical protein N2745_06230, partial [Syntrophorhabdaceae bacterium]|nr:hypothetical protein [Syntrophorhabdaceae bacterium]
FTDTQTGVTGGRGGRSSCLFAELTNNTKLAFELDMLRKFRDKYLATNVVGRKIVKWYYKCSPSLVSFMMEHKDVRVVLQIAVAPIIYTIKYPMMLAIVVVPITVMVRRKGKS